MSHTHVFVGNTFSVQQNFPTSVSFFLGRISNNHPILFKEIPIISLLYDNHVSFAFPMNVGNKIKNNLKLHVF